jgi:hypothetical protein
VGKYCTWVPRVTRHCGIKVPYLILGIEKGLEQHTARPTHTKNSSHPIHFKVHIHLQGGWKTCHVDGSGGYRTKAETLAQKRLRLRAKTADNQV